MEINQLLSEIKDAAYAVRLALFPGFLESVYQNALLLELRSRGLRAEKEAPIRVFYRGECVGDFRADILVEQQVIIEVKAASALNKSHAMQVVNYLHATGLDHAFLINYGSQDYAIHHKTRIYAPRSL